MKSIVEPAKAKGIGDQRGNATARATADTAAVSKGIFKHVAVKKGCHVLTGGYRRCRAFFFPHHEVFSRRLYG